MVKIQPIDSKLLIPLQAGAWINPLKNFGQKVLTKACMIQKIYRPLTDAMDRKTILKVFLLLRSLWEKESNEAGRRTSALYSG